MSDGHEQQKQLTWTFIEEPVEWTTERRRFLRGRALSYQIGHATGRRITEQLEQGIELTFDQPQRGLSPLVPALGSIPISYAAESTQTGLNADQLVSAAAELRNLMRELSPSAFRSMYYGSFTADEESTSDAG